MTMPNLQCTSTADAIADVTGIVPPACTFDTQRVERCWAFYVNDFEARNFGSGWQKVFTKLVVCGWPCSSYTISNNALPRP